MSRDAEWRPYFVNQETPEHLVPGPVERYWDGDAWTDRWRAGKATAGSQRPATDGNGPSGSSDMAIGVIAVIVLVVLGGWLISTISIDGSSARTGDPAGMIDSCRAARGAGSEVDVRESSAWQPSDSDTASVTLRDSSGSTLGECQVEVTRDTYRVR